MRSLTASVPWFADMRILKQRSLRPSSQRPGERLADSSKSARAFPLALAVLWGFHAAAFGYPGRAYFYATGLNDASKSLQANILLHPAFVCAALFAVLRVKSRPAVSAQAGKCGISVALGCWMLAATLSTCVNAGVDQVVLSYVAVFVAGLAVYLSLANRPVTSTDLEIAIVGLVVGSLFPLIGGLQAFVQEWGVPDTGTTLNAYRNLFRMQMYEAATFGNRGNTAAFVVIVAPLCLWVAFDRSRSLRVRSVCCATLIPVLLNLMVLQVRAAMLTVFFSLSVISLFRFGLRRYPLVIGGFGITMVLFFQYSPDVALLMSDRLRPVVTADSNEDASLLERTESIKEGVATAQRNWQLGDRPRRRVDASFTHVGAPVSGAAVPGDRAPRVDWLHYLLRCRASDARLDGQARARRRDQQHSLHAVGRPSVVRRLWIAREPDVQRGLREHVDRAVRVDARAGATVRGETSSRPGGLCRQATVSALASAGVRAVMLKNLPYLLDKLEPSVPPEHRPGCLPRVSWRGSRTGPVAVMNPLLATTHETRSR